MAQVNRIVGTALVVAFSLWFGRVHGVDAAQPRCNGVLATITGAGPINGTDGADVIVGSNGNDQINGNGGDDIICGLNGDDLIVGGDGNDWISGGKGHDTIDGGADNDTMFGEAGNDTIEDTSGANVAHGGNGTDYVSVAGQAYGDSGDDNLIEATETGSGLGDAIADGGSGNDNVLVSGGAAIGGSGYDTVYAVYDGDTIFASSGRDDVRANNGTAQTLDCGSAYDSFTADTFDTVLPNCEQDNSND